MLKVSPTLLQYLQRTMDPQFIYKADHTRNSFLQMLVISMQCTSVFSTPHSTVLTINVSITVEPCFVCKNKLSDTKNPSCTKNDVLNYTITTKLATNKAEARQCTCAERLRKCLKCPLQWKGRFLYGCFSIYRSLGCVLYGIPYIRTNILGNTLHIL